MRRLTKKQVIILHEILIKHSGGADGIDDWIVVYKVDVDRLKLMLSRTGTHVGVYGQ